MQKMRSSSLAVQNFLLTTAGTLFFTTLILLISGISPLAVYQLLFFGAFSSPSKIADLLMLAAPLLLCAAGLTLTFAAGLYNLGIEGQLTLGAIFALLPLRLWPDLPPPLLWTLAFLAGALGGSLWATSTACLKIYAQVNEIFAGLGMNFLAMGIALYLVFGPWQRIGTASMSGTEPLPNELWLPMLPNLRLAPLAPLLALSALGIVWFLLAHTKWGISVRATGLNPIAAENLGVPTNLRLFETMFGCGILAGIAGAIQILGVFHGLIPNVSSGVGLLALLIVLLVQAQPIWLLPIVLLFASFAIGSVQLPLALNVDSNISGVLQGSLVLFALMARGIQERRQKKH